MHEHQLIDALRALATTPVALGLADDAAILPGPGGQDYVITKDAIAEGVHFVGDEPPELIARKLLRTNLSDLAAMGAQPQCYFTALMLPPGTDEPWLRGFLRGLEMDQREFGIVLAGGDTTATKGGLGLSLTAIGTVPTGAALRRGTAKVGDMLCVSGTIGDAALGLLYASTYRQVVSGQEVAQTDLALERASPQQLLERRDYLRARYLLPLPRVTLGLALRGMATSCIDVSDGLIQDGEALCKASGVGAVVALDKIPISDVARQMQASFETLFTGGDDYELLFTVPQEKLPQLNTISLQTLTPVSVIGRIVDARDGMVWQRADGTLMEFTQRRGYRHQFA